MSHQLIGLKKHLPLLYTLACTNVTSLWNAPATFQRMIQPNTNSHIDDLVAGSDSCDAHLQAVEQLFQGISKANLTVNFAKSEFGQTMVIYLGYWTRKNCPSGCKGPNHFVFPCSLRQESHEVLFRNTWILP